MKVGPRLRPWTPIFKRDLKYGDQFTPGAVVGATSVASPLVTVPVSIPTPTVTVPPPNGYLYQAIQDLGPLSHWPMRETSGTTLDDVGSLANDSTSAASAELGDATAPDGFPCPVFTGLGNQGGSAPDQDGYSPSHASGITVVVAVRPEIGGGSGGVLLSKRADNGTAPEWEVGYNGTNGNTYGLTWVTGTTVARQITQNAAMVDETWALIIVRFGAGATDFPSLRINGSNVGSTSGSGTAASADVGRLQLGRRQTSSTQMQGQMSNAAIFAGQLSDGNCGLIEAGAQLDGYY